MAPKSQNRDGGKLLAKASRQHSAFVARIFVDGYHAGRLVSLDR